MEGILYFKVQLSLWHGYGHRADVKEDQGKSLEHSDQSSVQLWFITELAAPWLYSPLI